MRARKTHCDAQQETPAGDRPGRGKVAEFDAAGRLVRVLGDQGRLNAPWDVALTPAEFGALGGTILVGNFGGAGRTLDTFCEENPMRCSQ